MIIPEIVAPAGNFAKLKIVLAYGADAVCAGVDNFSLRSRIAREFNYESFEEAVEYTHQRGKKVYVVLNGLHLGGQIEFLKKHILKLKETKPDAFIVAPVGAMALVRELAPEIALHVSTQANALNYLDARVYKNMDIKRIVTARELSLKDVKSLEENCDIELKAFVHGSMCFAYSGRCLISLVQSGRMSNRGSCANDYRFDYELYAKNPENGVLSRLGEDENGTHISNSRGLNLCSYIEKIMKEDCISAFKIEGRTESEYYVALTARTHKMAIQDVLEGKFEAGKYEKEIATLKSRGFTDDCLASRPLGKADTQDHDTSIEEGTHQVYTIVEDGEYFKYKGRVVLNKAYEILMPLGDEVETCDNELGKIYKKENKYLIEFKKLISKNNKEFNETHNGNENEIKVPNKISGSSSLRKEVG